MFFPDLRDYQNLHRDRLSNWFAIDYTTRAITIATTCTTTTSINFLTTTTNIDGGGSFLNINDI